MKLIMSESICQTDNRRMLVYIWVSFETFGETNLHGKWPEDNWPSKGLSKCQWSSLFDRVMARNEKFPFLGSKNMDNLPTLVWGETIGDWFKLSGKSEKKILSHIQRMNRDLGEMFWPADNRGVADNIDCAHNGRLAPLPFAREIEREREREREWKFLSSSDWAEANWRAEWYSGDLENCPM